MIPEPSGRHVALDLLRTFLVLLLVAHHAVLAYHPYAPPQESLGALSLAWTAYPIVDTQRWPGIEAFIHFNDIFFMSLFFLIAGVFSWPSLARRGGRAFLRGRVRRLGLPFLVAACAIAPAAYYPTYLVTHADPRFGDFLRQWLTLDVWPAGPAWFLWVLLAFSAAAATAFTWAPRAVALLARFAERISENPLGAAGALIVLSALAYVPLAIALDPWRWASAGPFWLQPSRVLHYAAYFFVGVGLGAYGIRGGLLASDGALAQRWPLFTILALAAFALAGAVQLATVSKLERGGPGPLLASLGYVAFVVSCAASSFGFLALFLRFGWSRHPMIGSLSANSYGIFLLHFAFVTWLQLLLLPASMPGAAKGLLVSIAAVLLSWSLSATLRRIPAVASVV